MNFVAAIKTFEKACVLIVLVAKAAYAVKPLSQHIKRKVWEKKHGDGDQKRP